MILPRAPFLTAAVTVLAVLFYFHAAFMVGQLRGRLGNKAPATKLDGVGPRVSIG